MLINIYALSVCSIEKIILSIMRLLFSFVFFSSLLILSQEKCIIGKLRARFITYFQDGVQSSIICKKNAFINLLLHDIYKISRAEMHKAKVRT